MKYKKGDLVRVIEARGCDKEYYGIIKGEIYEVLYLHGDNNVYINAGKGNRLMCSSQVERVKKKKSKKDLRIEELENAIKEMAIYLANK